MRFRAVANVLGGIVLLFSSLMVVPALLAAGLREPAYHAVAFLGPAGLGILLGFCLFHFNREEGDQLRDREALVAIGGGWLVVSAIAALPFRLQGTLPAAEDAFFEAMSGLCTAGYTVIPDLGDRARVSWSILFWRSFLQWLGGLGFVVLSVLVLSHVRGGHLRLSRAEAATTAGRRLMPRIRDVASRLWQIYAVLTAVPVLLLIAAGVAPLEALIHIMSAVSTGGFATHSDSLRGFNSAPLIGTVVFITMVLGGTNFSLLHDLGLGRVRAVLGDPEFRGYVGIILTLTILVGALVAGNGAPDDPPLVEVFAHAAFTVVSLMTTTGFVTADFDRWPSAAKLLLMFGMFAGGMAGSTSGAVKVIRIIVLAKVAAREVDRLLHPNVVAPIRLAGRPLPEDRVHATVAFTIVYTLLLGFFTVLVAATGVPPMDAFAGSLGALGNVGVAFGSFGPCCSLAPLHPAAKVAISIAIWLGRLEIFAGLVLFFPATYRR